ncbi:MAG: TonB-dependent receptor [Gammaproteobacteria bacterium]|nr:TonB-dependent receptor [Gammaproteobacteria bacterium]
MAKTFPYKALSACVFLALGAQAQESEPEKNKTTEQDVEIIEVQGVRLADQKARGMERAADAFSNVVATDDLGNFVDQNIAESLRRLPGVTLERNEGEGTHVAIRGLGPNFVSVSMNGAQMAGAGDERKVGLDGISGDSLGAIEVFKTLTPEMNLNSIGGMVNVKAISAYDKGKDSFKFKLQNSYQDLSQQHSPKFTFDGTSLLFDEMIGIGYSAGFENRMTHVEEFRQHDTSQMSFRKFDAAFVDGDPETLDIVNDDGMILAPVQYEKRLEDAERERKSANINLEIRPSDLHSFYVRANYSSYADNDIALREKFDFADGGLLNRRANYDEITGELLGYSYSSSGEHPYVNAETKEFIVTDIDLQNQYFIQEGDNVTKTFSLGGKHLLGDYTTFDYEVAHSESESEIKDGRRAQFRERDLIVYGQGHKDRIDAMVLTPAQAAEISGMPIDFFDGANNSDTRGDATTYDTFDLDNIFLEDSTRTDTIETVKLNLKQEFDSDWINYVKVGGTSSKRSHVRGKDRWSFIPTDGQCLQDDQVCADVQNSVLSDYANEIPDTGNFSYALPTRDSVEYIIDAIGYTADSATGGTTFESTRDDYEINEDAFAVYAMTELQLMDDMTLITGVRYVETEFASTGFMSINNDKFNFGLEKSLDISIPLPQAKITYSEYYPSAHLRYEPTDEILIRGSIWTSYTRPSFKQARAFAKLDSRIELCDPHNITNCADEPDDLGSPNAIELQGYLLGSDNALDVGNPNLVAMSSTNFDSSIGWYPNKDLFFEVSLFYKDITNFIYDAVGIRDSISNLPLTLPVDHISAFAIPQDLVLNDINITLNGDDAAVMGMELSYNQFFESGFFIQSNTTFLDSEAKVDDKIRVEKVKMPNQADITANLAIGWENDDFSARVIGNYRSKILDAIGACPADADPADPWDCRVWNDRYIDAISTVDFKVKYDLTKNLSMYFDAINLTEEVDLKYYQGNQLSGGNIAYKNEFYGTSYQLGMTYKFY